MTSLKQIWANKNYRISAIIALVLVLWLASGMVVNTGESQSQPEASANAANPEGQSTKALTQVRARRMEAKAYPLAVGVTGQTEVNRFVNLRAEVGGQVEAVPVTEGSLVETGDVICQLAVEDRAQRLEEAKAAVEQARIDYDGAQRLETEGYQSKTAIATAKAVLESAKANLIRRQLDLEKTEIRAPFAGVVDDRPAEIGDLIRPGDTCATLIDLDPLIVTAELSEEEVIRIEKGEKVKARLATGEGIQGEIRYIARRPDEITRTFRVEAAVDNPEMRLLSGITADLQILVGEVPAHQIPASVLILDDKGELGVRVLDQDKRVRMYPVDLIGDSGDGVWVTGLPQSTLLITVGHQYVGVGEKVAVTLEDNESAMSALQ